VGLEFLSFSASPRRGSKPDHTDTLSCAARSAALRRSPSPPHPRCTGTRSFTARHVQMPGKLSDFPDKLSGPLQ
jgi:hypothetical protein